MWDIPEEDGKIPSEVEGFSHLASMVVVVVVVVVMFIVCRNVKSSMNFN
jgi:hypothetical protein